MEETLDWSRTRESPEVYPTQDILEVMEEGTKEEKNDSDSVQFQNSMKKVEFVSCAPWIKSKSDSESDASSVTSGSGSGSGSDASSVATSDVYLEDHCNHDAEAKPVAPWARDVQLLGSAKKAIEEDEGWKSFLLQHKSSCGSSELCEKTLEDENKNEEKGQHDNRSTSSSRYSSDVSEVSSDDSSFHSKMLDDAVAEEESVVDEEESKEKFNENVAAITTAEDWDLDALRSKLQFSTFQASLLETAFKGMNKRKDQDHKRIVQLEQAVADAEDMIACLIDEANSQHKEREIKESLLENAREQDAKQNEEIRRLKNRIVRKDTIACKLRSNLQEQKQQQAAEKAKYQSRLNFSDSLVRDAYDEVDSKKLEIAMLENVVKQLKAEKMMQDADKIETVSLLEETQQEIKRLNAQNAALKGTIARLQRKVPELEYFKAKRVLQEHFAKENNRKHTDTMKHLNAQNAALKGTIAGLQRKVPKLESQVKIFKAKYVLQEHLAKVNNRKRKSSNALFNQMQQRLVERIGSLDSHSLVLSNRLEEHLEKQKKDAVQKELLQTQLQDANEKLYYSQKAARFLENDLNELKAKFEEKDVEKQVVAQVVNKERVKHDLQETHAKLNPSEKVIKILESDFDQLKKQTKDKDVAEKQVSALQAKLRFANAKESLLSKALSGKNSDNMEQEDRLKEMSEKVASLRSNLCMKCSENELLVAKLQDLEEQRDLQPETAAESGSDSLDCDKSADKTKSKNCNRKVNSLEAELSLLQVPEVIVADASLIDSWSAGESEKGADSDDLYDGSLPNEDAELVPEIPIANEDEDEWDFLSHSTPIEQEELWC